MDNPFLLTFASLKTAGATTFGFSNVLYASMVLAVNIVPDTFAIFALPKSISIFCSLSGSTFARVM